MFLLSDSTVSRRSFVRSAAVGGVSLAVGGAAGYLLGKDSKQLEPVARLEMNAPDFRLPSTLDRDISLSDYRGKHVVLVFYPEDFTPVCSTEVPEFNRRLSDFENLNAQVVGISVQDVLSLKKWIDELGCLQYPLLSDVDKQVSRKYGVLRHDNSVSLRGTFIIDTEGMIQFMNIHNMEVGRSVDEIVRVLEAIETVALCPVEWKPETATQSDV